MPEIIDPSEMEWLSRLETAGAFDESASGQNFALRSWKAWDKFLETSGLLQYPNNLGFDNKLANYVLFDIYDTGGEALKKENSSITKKKNKKELFGGKIDLDDIKEDVEDTTEDALDGAADDDVAEKLLKEVGDRVEATINLFDPDVDPQQLANAAAGFGIRSFNQSRLGFGNNVNRIGLSIALPMPAQLNSKYGFEYEDTDFTGLANAVVAAKGLRDAAVDGELTPEAKELTRKIVSIPSSVLDSLSNIIGKEDINLTDALNLKERKAPNKFKEQVFKGVERRTFDFEYEFYPTSPEDALRIYAIVYAFKKYSHPKRTEGGLFLDYPGQFKIGFYNKLLLNDFLFRIGLCACTSCEVTYGGDDLNFFRNYTANTGPFSPSTYVYGAPANVIKMKLSFTELEILTRERIQQGY